MEPATQHAYDSLRDSLTEAQATVRSYDTKAQIIMVGYIFALGIFGRIGETVVETTEVGIAYFVVAWGVAILPILLFGFVLYPSRKTAPLLSEESIEDLQGVLYVSRIGIPGSTSSSEPPTARTLFAN